MIERICPQCGKTHPEGALFCPQTGQPIEVREAQPGQSQSSSHMFCPNCMRAVQREWRACPICGTVFSSAPPALTRMTPVSKPLYATRKPLYSKRPQPLFFCGSFLLTSILLFSAACLFIYLLLGLNQTNRTARIVPAKTAVLVTFSPSIWQMPSLLHFQNLQKGGAVFAAVPGIGNALTEINTNFPKTELDFQADILPWIGNEVSIAQLNSEDLNTSFSTNNGPQLASYPGLSVSQYDGSPMLLTITTRNSRRSGAFLVKVLGQWEEQGIRFKESDYRGIHIIEVISPDRMPLAFATYKGLVMVGTDVRVIAVAIDTGQGNQKQSLYAQNNYQETLKQLPANRLGVIFFNWADLKERVNNESAENTLLAMFNLSAVENVGCAFGLEPNGLRFDYVLAYDTSRITDTQMKQLRQSPTTNALTKTLPEDAIVYLSGSDMALSWKITLEDIARISGTNFDAHDLDNSLHEFRLQTGVDLEEDLFANMQGEYALALVRDPSGLWGDQSIPLGALLAIELSDSQQVEESMQAVARIVERDSNSTIRLVSDRIGENEAWFLQDHSSGEKNIGYTIANRVMWLGSSERILRALGVANDESLAANQDFRKIMNALPNNARYYLCMDVQKFVNVIRHNLADQAQYNNNIQPYVRDLQTIGISLDRMNNQELVRGTILVFTR